LAGDPGSEITNRSELAAAISNSSRGDLAITLSGGGARAAYQVGVLRGLARHLPEARPVILTGESAGAINVAYLAAYPGVLPKATEDLASLWSQLTADQLFRIDPLSLAHNVLRWGTRLISGGAAIAPKVSGLLDTAPLRSLLERSLETVDGEMVGITKKLQTGLLKAIALTTINYSTGQTVTWVQGGQILDWERPLRRSVRSRLTVDHVLASAALPLMFPAVKLGNDWYGDGGVRLHAPLSPAIHLGARRILAVSTRYQPTHEEADRPAVHGYPAPAQVAGILLDAIFLDLIDYDAMVLERLNRLLGMVPQQDRGELRQVDLLVIRPSQDLAKLAANCESRLPRGLRFLTRGLGTRESSRPELLSLLMFVPEYLQVLMRIGESDVEARLDEITKFVTD
jgi:NTE family protein